MEHWATGELQTAILASWMSTHSLILMRRVKDGTNNVIARKINQRSGRVNLQTTSKKKLVSRLLHQTLKLIWFLHWQISS